MATINRQLAEELIKGNGKSKHGTAGYCLVRYQNRMKYNIQNTDMFDPEAKINVFDYAIFSSKRKYEEFMNSDTVGGVDVLWESEKFKKDDAKRELALQQTELMEGAADILNYYEQNETPKRSRRER